MYYMILFMVRISSGSGGPGRARTEAARRPPDERPRRTIFVSFRFVPFIFSSFHGPAHGRLRQGRPPPARRDPRPPAATGWRDV